MGVVIHRPAPLGLVRFGCGLCLGIILAALLLLGSIVVDPAPRSAPIPTGPQPGASAAFGSADASARVQAAASGWAPLGAPRHPTATQRGGAPQPTGEIGTALYSATATWCAPTEDQCQAWGGDARLAAVHSFRYGDRPYRVRVWRGPLHVDVLVVSFCRCRDRDDRIDLSPSAFAQLADLELGAIRVEVEGPIGPLPATDTR